MDEPLPMSRPLAVLSTASAIVSLISGTPALLALGRVEVGMPVVVIVMLFVTAVVLGLGVVAGGVLIVLAHRKRHLARVVRQWRFVPLGLVSLGWWILSAVGFAGLARGGPSPSVECATRLGNHGVYVCVSPEEFERAVMSSQLFMSSGFALVFGLLSLCALAVGSALAQA